MTTMRRAALAAITILVAAASASSFAESYRALYDWATRHGLHGGWAVVWPLQVDTFIAVGELALFVALADRWAVRSRAAAWTVTLAGLAVSVAGNVGHIAGHDLASRATAAVPPLAAAAALAVGLGVLKRVVNASGKSLPPGGEFLPAVSTTVVSHLPVTFSPRGGGNVTAECDSAVPAEMATLNGHAAKAVELYAADLASGSVPSIRRIRSEMHVGQPKAQAITEYLRSLTRT